MAHIPVLSYHNISNNGNSIYTIKPPVFEKHMCYLSVNNYRSISLERFSKLVSKKSVIITFDDGYKDTYTYAIPILKKYKLKAVFFVCPGLIKEFPDKYMSWKDLKNLSNQGHSIQSHTMNHLNMLRLDKNRIIEEAKLSKSILERKLKVPVDYMAYPYGKFNKHIEKLCLSVGYKGLFTTNFGLNDTSKALKKAKRIPVTNRDGYKGFIGKVRGAFFSEL